MSWQDYVDKQLLASRCVTKAAIAGHDGNVWAKSEGFDVSTCPPDLTQCFVVFLPEGGPPNFRRPPPKSGPGRTMKNDSRVLAPPES